MQAPHPRLVSDRRRFLAGLGLGTAAFFTEPGAFAGRFVFTPKQTEGPFYPDRLPLDTDNDLLIINDSLTPAVGEVAWVSGYILDRRGDPIRNATVEIWQCDQNGVYLHTGSDNKARQDAHFQGFGRFVTGSRGEYAFRTIRPVPYTGRTPHIHFAVKRKGYEKFTTQLYVKGHPGNEKDSIWKSLGDAGQRRLCTVPFAPLKHSKIGELGARFDIVLGATPSA